MITAQTKREMARWYKLKPHVAQLALVEAVGAGVLYPLVPAGRRSGKTERFKRFLVKQAMRVPGQYFAAAPTHDQAKKIFWADLCALALASLQCRAPNISERIIYLDNGSEIHVLGLDKPQRIEGIPWKGGGIDEFADIKAIAGIEYRRQATDQSDYSISSYGRYDSPSLLEKQANQSLLGIYATFQKDWSGKYGLETSLAMRIGP